MFLLKMSSLYFSDGTRSYLDGRLLRREDHPDGVLVSAGEHELRVEVSRRTVTHRLNLRPEKDDGILYLDDPQEHGEPSRG